MGEGSCRSVVINLEELNSLHLESIQSDLSCNIDIRITQVYHLGHEGT